jgi:hypothetical protein
MATMLQRMFSSQLFGMAIDSTVPEEAAGQEHQIVQDVDMADCRYPKRKRTVFSYLDDSSDFELSDDDEEDFEPKAKVHNYSIPCYTGYHANVKQRAKASKPLPKHRIFPFM